MENQKVASRKSITQPWRVSDLIGFARPAGMPMDKYRELRKQKNADLALKQKPVLIWKTSPKHSDVNAALETEKKFPGFIKSIWRDRKGTYIRRLHGAIGVEAKKGL